MFARVAVLLRARPPAPALRRGLSADKTTASTLDDANKRITITRLLSRQGEETDERRARLLFQSRFVVRVDEVCSTFHSC